MAMIISDIKKKKLSFIIFFDNGKELELSEETYTDYYFYVGKEVTDSGLLELESKENLVRFKKYCVSLLMKKDYSIRQIVDKLKLKKLDDFQIGLVVDYLKDIHLLDDKKYYENLIFSLENKGYGYYYIVNKLDGCFYYEYNESLEKERVCLVLPNLIKKYSLLYSLAKMKNSIYNSLVSMGYKNEVIKYGLSQIIDSEFLDSDKIKLQQEFLKMTYKLSKNEIFNKKDKIISKLLMRGYSYNDIIELVNGEF